MKKTSNRLADGREIIYYDLRDDAVRDARRRASPRRDGHRVRDPLRPAARGVDGRHRAPAGPHLPPARRRLPPLPDPRRAASARSPNRTTTSPCSRTASPPSPAGPGPEAADGPHGLLRAPPRRRPLRSRLLHRRPPRLLRRPSPTSRRGWCSTPGRTAPRSSPNCPASSRSSASRTAARRSASPSSTRTARSTPIPSPPPAPRACSDSVAGHAARTGGRNLFDDVLDAELADGRRVVARERALGRLRAARRALALRGAPVSPAPGAGPAGAGRGGARGVPRRSIWTCCAASTASSGPASRRPPT